jgi:hypothetical protein
MRLAALLCHCRSWIQVSRFREQVLRFGEAFQSFLTSNPPGDPRERILIATMSPANCLRTSADDRTILGASFVHSLVAHKSRTEPPACSQRPTFISAGVISRAFATGAVVVQNADPHRQTNPENECADRQAKRATGIEPAWPAWKAGTLPLSYARAKNKLPRHPIPAKLFLTRRRFDRLLFGEAAASYLGL